MSEPLNVNDLEHESDFRVFMGAAKIMRKMIETMRLAPEIPRPITLSRIAYLHTCFKKLKDECVRRMAHNIFIAPHATIDVVREMEDCTAQIKEIGSVMGIVLEPFTIEVPVPRSTDLDSHGTN